MLTLVGIVIVVIGFVLRINPLLVVTIAGLATGIASGLGPLEVIAAFGKAFITSRYVAIVWLVLPVIGMQWRHAGPPLHPAFSSSTSLSARSPPHLASLHWADTRRWSGR